MRIVRVSGILMREGGHREAIQTYSLVPRSFGWNSGGVFIGRRHVGFRPLCSPQGLVKLHVAHFYATRRWRSVSTAASLEDAAVFD